MARWRQRLEDGFAAVACAEANEAQWAVEVALSGSPTKRRSWTQVLSDTFVSVALAEAGLRRAAMELLMGQAEARPDHGKRLEAFLKDVGLEGVTVRFGIAYV